MGTILTGTKKESKLTVGIQGITNEGGFFNSGDMQVRQQFIVGTNGITNSDRYFGLGDVTCPGLSFIDASITPSGVWAGALEPKVISAKYELFFKDAQGNDVQITKDGAVNAGSSGQSLVPIVWSLPGTLGISDGAAPYHTASKDLTLTDCEMVVKTAPVGGTVSIDIEVDTAGKTGAMPSFATIFSTLPTIDSGEYSSESAATPCSLSTTAVAKGDILRLNVDGVNGAKDLTVSLIAKAALIT